MLEIYGEEKKIAQLKESFKGLLGFNLFFLFVAFHTSLDYWLIKYGDEKIVSYQIPSELQYEYVDPAGRESTYVALSHGALFKTKLECNDYCPVFADENHHFQEITLLERYYAKQPEKIESYSLISASYLNNDHQLENFAYAYDDHVRKFLIHDLEQDLKKYAMIFTSLLMLCFFIFLLTQFNENNITPYIRLTKKDYVSEFKYYKKIMLYGIVINIAVIWLGVFCVLAY